MAVKPNTADRVLDTFRDLDDVVTANQIMDVTGLSRTTVNDNLRKLAEAGKVVRFDKDNVAEWRLTPAQKKANKAAARKIAKLAKPPAGDTADVRRGRAVAAKADHRTAEVRERAADEADVTEARRRSEETHDQPQRTASGRRRKGEIDGEIVEFFRGNGNTPEGSYRVAQSIGSSAGAAYVALNRMEREGSVVKTQTDPDRFALPS